MKTVYDTNGREVPDSTPVAIPLGFHKPPSLQDEIKRFVRSELSAAAERQDLESFTDADDFDVDEDTDLPVSPHEIQDMHSERVAESFEVMPNDRRHDAPIDRKSKAAGEKGGDDDDELARNKTDKASLADNRDEVLEGERSDRPGSGPPDRRRKPVRAAADSVHSGVRKKSERGRVER